MEGIVNRVEQSGIITLDLGEFYHPGERVVYDIKDNLFQELILREKDFRQFIKTNDWEVYKGKNVAIICSVDAIVPAWAYMLLASKLNQFAHKVVFGGLDHLEQALFHEQLLKINTNEFVDKRVVVKGCGDLPVPVFAYVEVTNLLTPVVKSLMFGEPCSTVPVYKKPKN
ncbi:DUF2480 family protein [Cytophagaceae bacterium ABcell3]|nr:DUF2480 family protein [Cytophagaceae bacterium ABcell3]